VTRAEALAWGKDDHRRIATRDLPGAVVALVDERLRGRRCVDCSTLGLVTPDDEPLELDHLKPLSNGGDNHHLNLTWRCRSHNRARGARPVPLKPGRPAWERRR
jgi:5-methylcytosine-specific restriction endonuclease McrA